jgi:hypothetical protein
MAAFLRGSSGSGSVMRRGTRPRLANGNAAEAALKFGAGGRNRTDTSVRKPDFASHYGFRHFASASRGLSALMGWTLSSPWAFAVRWLPLSLYTFPIARAWLGVGIVERRKLSPNLTTATGPFPDQRPTFKSGASTSSATPALHQVLHGVM